MLPVAEARSEKRLVVDALSLRFVSGMTRPASDTCPDIGSQRGHERVIERIGGPDHRNRVDRQIMMLKRECQTQQLREGSARGIARRRECVGFAEVEAVRPAVIRLE